MSFIPNIYRFLLFKIVLIDNISYCNFNVFDAFSYPMINRISINLCYIIVYYNSKSAFLALAMQW